MHTAIHTKLTYLARHVPIVGTCTSKSAHYFLIYQLEGIASFIYGNTSVSRCHQLHLLSIDFITLQMCL